MAALRGKWFEQRRSGRPARNWRLGFDLLENRVVPTVILTEEHVDIAVDYFSGDWHPGIVNHDTFPAIISDTADTLLTVGPEARVAEPASLGFLGAGTGNDVWILSQNQNFNTLYMGFEAQRTPFSLLPSYTENDPRVNGVTGPWIKVTLKAVRGPGHFSVWSTSAFGAPTLWMSSFQGGITSLDNVFVPASGHLHYNWGFSARGSYQIDLQASSFLGPGLTNPISSPIFTVTFLVDPPAGGINQPPVHSGPANQTTPEDTPLTLGGATRLTVTDPDAGASNVQTTVAVTAGTGALTLATLAGLTVTGNDTSSVTMTGPLTAVNAALNGLVYTPAANFTGPTTLTITTDDLGNTGSGGAKTDTDTLTITVAATNDAPTHSVPGDQNVPLGANRVFSAGNGNALVVADADAGTSPVQTTVSVTPGSGTVQLATTSGLTVSGNNTSSVTLTGSLTAVNAALNGLTYKPGSFAGLTTLTITTNDLGNTGSGGSKITTNTVSVTVGPATPNLPPTNTVPGTQTIPEDAILIFSPAGSNRIAVADPDAGAADLKVTLTVTGGKLHLAATANLTVTGDNTAAVTLTGSLTAINAALNGLTYTPPAEFSGSVTLTVKTDDLGHTGLGGAKTDTDTVTITINAVNDAPINTVPGSQSVLVDSALTFAAGNAIAVADADVGANSLQVTLTVTTGVLALSGSAGLAVSGDGTASILLTGPLSAINTALNGMVYTPPTGFLGAATLTIVTNDQGFSGPGGPKSDTDTVTLNVQVPNIGPVNTVPGDLTTAEDTPLPLSGANAIAVADSDAGSGPVQVVVAVAPGSGVFAVGSPAGVTVAGDGSASVTLTGPLAALNAALAGLVFTPASNLINVITVNVISNDLGSSGFGGSLTDTDTFTITVTPVNDAPVHNLPGQQTTKRNVPLVFTAANSNRITVADPDAAGQAVQTTLSVQHGTLSLAGTSGLTVVGNGTATVTLTGTIGNINAALNGLVYKAAAGYSGPDTLTVTTNDQGHEGAGGTQSTTDTVELFVRAKTAAIYVTAADAGGPAKVRVFNAATGRLRLVLWPYGPAFRGGIRVATGDFNRDGVLDIAAAPGPGGGSRIRVFNGQTGKRLAGPLGRFKAFNSKAPNGVFVAAGDVDHDGFDDLIVGGGAGKGQVRVFSGATGALLQDFAAFKNGAAGGAHVAAADVNGDGFADIIAGAGSSPWVQVFDGANGQSISTFRAHPRARSGVFVAAGDVNGDGRAEIVTGLATGSQQVTIRNAQTGQLLTKFNAFPSGFSTPIPGQVHFAHGVRVAVADFNSDGKVEIIAASGPGHSPQVRVFRALPTRMLDSFFAFAAAYPGGVFVAGK